MQIGKIKVKTPIFLAPMAGVTDYPFRVLCKKLGAGVVYSEFVSAHGIIRENIRTHNMIRFSEFERHIGIQIFGDCPEIMSKAARMIVDKFKPDIVDINYGCPVPKITRRGAGSAALKDLCLSLLIFFLAKFGTLPPEEGNKYGFIPVCSKDLTK